MRGIRRRPDFRFAPLLALAILFSGCSTKVYAPEVVEFNKGVQSSSEIFSKYEQLAYDGYTQFLVTSIPLRKTSSHLPPLFLAPSCLDAMEKVKSQTREYNKGKIEKIEFSILHKECQINVVEGDAKPRQVTNEMLFVNGGKLLKEILKYSKLLTTIVESKDMDELFKSAANMETALNSFYTTMGTAAMSGQALKPAGPLTALLLQIGKSALEMKRFLVLKEAVTRANEVIIAATGLLSKAANNLYVEALYYRAQIMDYDGDALMTKKVTEKTKKAMLSALLKEHNEFLTLLGDNPADTFDDMKKAHQALLDAVKDPTRQLESATAAVRDFAAKAEAVKNSLDTITQEDSNG